jgi:uncharacterized protein with GYD domain
MDFDGRGKLPDDFRTSSCSAPDMGWRRDKKGASMATYILLGTLTDEGADKLRLHPEWLTDVKENLEKTGIKVIAQYAVLGQYDIVNIVEAPDNKSIVRVSTELTLRGILKITTLPALPIEDFLATLR